MHWLLCTLLCACAALGVSFGLSAQISEEPMLPASQFQQLDNQYKELKNQWKNYKYKYNKQYENEDEERHRLVIYSENMRRVAEHNARHDQGLTTYTMELNRFADMTHQEFIDTMLMENMSNLEDQEYVSEFRWNKSMGPIPQKMDWRNQGAVTPVKDQGYCRSCWAFSATGALEGQHYIKWRRLVSLSEQNLLDCSKSFGNYACKGGYVATSYNYIRMNGGIDTEYSYPYEGKVDTCRYKSRTRGATDAGSVSVARGEGHLLAAVARLGPIATYIDARPLQFYKGGVLYNHTCSVKYPNHAVLVIGYGRETTGGAFWLVKNSWGSWWGEQGYFKLARNRKNHCGVASDAVYPLV